MQSSRHPRRILESLRNFDSRISKNPKNILLAVFMQFLKHSRKCLKALRVHIRSHPVIFITSVKKDEACHEVVEWRSINTESMMALWNLRIRIQSGMEIRWGSRIKKMRRMFKNSRMRIAWGMRISWSSWGWSGSRMGMKWDMRIWSGSRMRLRCGMKIFGRSRMRINWGWKKGWLSFEVPEWEFNED